MGDAANEMHLLKEAEAHLGQAIWRDVEDIEGLSLEYWNLRKLIKEHELVVGKLRKCQEQLEAAHEERANLLNSTTEIQQKLLDERTKVLDELEELTSRRDEVVAQARNIRRSYDGIKAKIEVLEKENANTPEQKEQTAKRMAALKKSFADLKAERVVIAQKIEEGDKRIDEIEAAIEEQKKERRKKTSKTFHHIGDANQEMSTLRAELGLLDTQMRQLYSEIGRYISRMVDEDPACKKAGAKHIGLINVMGALRRSIQRNHKLADLS